MAYINPAETGDQWTPEEEAIIAGLMASDSVGRIEAIQAARRKWLIGESAPPMSRPGRAIPKANPRSQSVEDAERDRINPPGKPDLLPFQASTSTGKGLEPRRLPKAASVRQARWRAKKAAQAPERIAA